MADFLRNHFAHVFPILAAGAIAIVIAIDRARAVYLSLPMRGQEAFFAKLAELMELGRASDALALCEQNAAKPVARVARAAISRAHLPDDLIAHGVELEVKDATHAIQKRTGYLATIANVATLLGLLGTIAGLIQSFEAVGHADAQQKAAILAEGISTAMNATMLGLGVAIPCMIVFSLIVNRANALVGEIETGAVRSVDVVQRSFFGKAA